MRTVFIFKDIPKSNTNYNNIMHTDSIETKGGMICKKRYTFDSVNSGLTYTLYYVSSKTIRLKRKEL